MDGWINQFQLIGIMTLFMLFTFFYHHLQEDFQPQGQILPWYRSTEAAAIKAGMNLVHCKYGINCLTYLFWRNHVCSWPGNTTNYSLYSTVAILSLVVLQQEVFLALVLTEIYNFCFVYILMQLITMWKTICSLAFVNGIWNKETADGVLGYWMHNKFDPRSPCVIFQLKMVVEFQCKAEQKPCLCSSSEGTVPPHWTHKGQALSAPDHLCVKGKQKAQFCLWLILWFL